jgi:hypothetical protein
MQEHTDDISIIITGKNINELTSNLDTTNSIICWFDNHRLIINKVKSFALGFHHKLNKNIVFSDTILKYGHITYETETKFLGVTLNHTLKWDINLKNLREKFSKLFCY